MTDEGDADSGMREALEMCFNMAYGTAIDIAEAGVTWVAIHGRTRAQSYSGFADWDYIKEVKKHSPIPIIGNGDINSAEKAVSRLRESGCDGVMIGRGCLKNPWIFAQAEELWQEDKLAEREKNFTKMLERLKDLVDERKDVRYSLLQMKKFTAWFSAGYPSSQQFRRQLFSETTADGILKVSKDYFGRLQIANQLDTSHEAFLMGGHG
jgi:tRNA-dihydrouridine synthase